MGPLMTLIHCRFLLWSLWCFLNRQLSLNALWLWICLKTAFEYIETQLGFQAEFTQVTFCISLLSRRMSNPDNLLCKQHQTERSLFGHMAKRITIYDLTNFQVDACLRAHFMEKLLFCQLKSLPVSPPAHRVHLKRTSHKKQTIGMYCFCDLIKKVGL